MGPVQLDAHDSPREVSDGAVLDPERDPLEPSGSENTEPHLSDAELMDEVLTAIEEPGSTTMFAGQAADEREHAWQLVIEDLVSVEAPRSYVGTFARAMRAAIEDAEPLPPRDRRVAAAVIIDRTIARAESVADYREGLRAAVSVSPNILHPKLVVDRVLGTALRYAGLEWARASIGYALRTTVEALGGASERSLTREHLELLQAAITEAPEDVEEFRLLADKMHKRDRKAFLNVLPPPPDAKRKRR